VFSCKENSYLIQEHRQPLCISQQQLTKAS